MKSKGNEHESRQKRVKTGNWRPFRPAGMSDGTWRTILLLHRYPSADMDEEEQSHCLGPLLFGKGGARFGDYGRGWIQEQADALISQGKTPYAMDARAWRDEIVAAIDYYNGETFAEAQANGDVKADADFFTVNMPWREGDDESNEAVDRYFASRDVAASRMDEIWHTIAYGPYGEGPWHVLTAGVLNGWKDVFTCDENEAFYRTTDFDWRCAALFDNNRALDVQLMAEICPVCPNSAIFGGIDCACDMLNEGNLETRKERKLLRYLKRAFGELYKRRHVVGKNMRNPLPLLSFDRWLRKRKCWAIDRFGESVRPANDEVEYPRASEVVFEDLEAYARRLQAENDRLEAMWKAAVENARKLKEEKRGRKGAKS